MTNRVAIATGASGGIGQAVCHALGNCGVRVVKIVHNRDPLGIPGVSSARGNLMSANNTTLMAHDIVVREGAIDYLICCHAAPLGADFRSVIGVDLVGSWNICQAVLPHMKARGFGRIVLFSSIRAHWPRAGQTAYAAAKAGVEGLTRALAVEYGQYGITVNCIAPGAVDTPRTRDNIARGIVSERELLARTPTGALASAADVANCVLWLVSDGAASVNGQVIYVDGGWSVTG